MANIIKDFNIPGGSVHVTLEDDGTYSVERFRVGDKKRQRVYKFKDENKAIEKAKKLAEQSNKRLRWI